MRKLLGTATLAGIGFGLGLLLEEKLIGSLYRIDPDAVSLLSSVHTSPVRIVANDGASLYAEIDEFDVDAKADPRREDDTEINVEIETALHEQHPPHDDLTVIFCHGYGLDLDCWHYQRVALRSKARLVLYDQRGHGGSEQTPRESNTIDQLGEDLATVIDKVGGDGKVVLVGHSMGGMTIMSLAASHPDYFTSGKVAGVALLATTDAGLDQGTFGLPPSMAKTMHRYADITMDRALTHADTVNRIRARHSDLSLWLVKRYSFGSRDVGDFTAFTTQMLQAASMETVADFLLTLEVHDKSAALATLSDTPVSIVMGSADLLTPPQLYGEQMTTAMPHATYLLLPQTGHMLMLERSQEVTEVLEELLETVRGVHPETHGYAQR